MGKRSRAPTWNRESESAQRRHRWGWVPHTFQGEFRKVWRRHFKAQGSLRCVAWGRSPVYPGLRIVLLQTKRRERILLGNANGQEPQGAILFLRCRQGVAGENGFWELFDVPFVAWDSPGWSPASPGASTMERPQRRNKLLLFRWGSWSPLPQASHLQKDVKNM